MEKILKGEGSFEILQGDKHIYKGSFYIDDKGTIKDSKNNKELFNIERYPLKNQINMRNLNRDEDLELTTKLAELICDYLVKNEKCQDGNCDSCINKQARKIVELSDIS